MIDMQHHIPVPGFHIVGRGIDIFKDPPLGSDTRAKVFEGIGYYTALLDQRVFDGPNWTGYYTTRDITVIPRNGREMRNHYGRSFAEYDQHRAHSVGIEGRYRFFNASAEGRFQEENIEQFSSAFVSLFVEAQLYSLVLVSDALPPVKKALRDMLDNKTVQAEQIFEEWGTHYIACIRMGGYVRYDATVINSTSSSYRDLARAVAAKYNNGIVSADARFDVSEYTGDKIQSEHIHGSEQVYPMGLQYDPKTDFESWERILWQDAQPLNVTKYVPIGDLASTEARRSELARQYDTYARGFECVHAHLVQMETGLALTAIYPTRMGRAGRIALNRPAVDEAQEWEFVPCSNETGWFTIKNRARGWLLDGDPARVPGLIARMRSAIRSILPRRKPKRPIVYVHPANGSDYQKWNVQMQGDSILLRHRAGPRGSEEDYYLDTVNDDIANRVRLTKGYGHLSSREWLKTY